jgi:hypothetical protein
MNGIVMGKVRDTLYFEGGRGGAGGERSSLS